jgi:hypothetical protein
MCNKIAHNSRITLNSPHSSHVANTPHASCIAATQALLTHYSINIPHVPSAPYL